MNCTQTKPSTSLITKSTLAAGCAIACIFGSVGCDGPAAGEIPLDLQHHNSTPPPLEAEAERAILALPHVDTVEPGAYGLPERISGELGHSRGIEQLAKTVDPGERLDIKAVSEAVEPLLADVAPAFRVLDDDLVPVAAETDNLGMTHVRLDQTLHGLPVERGFLLLHFDAAGVLTSVNGSVATDTESVPEPAPSLDGEGAIAAAQAALREDPNAPVDLRFGEPTLMYVMTTGGQPRLTWAMDVASAMTATDDGMPWALFHETVYIAAHGGEIVQRQSHVYHATGCSQPGPSYRCRGNR